MKTEKQLELAEQLRDIDKSFSPVMIEAAFNPLCPEEIAAHRGAYGQAKSDFLRDMEREPESATDYYAILHRAEAIRKGEL
jgi:hypothetical protein